MTNKYLVTYSYNRMELIYILSLFLLTSVLLTYIRATINFHMFVAEHYRWRLWKMNNSDVEAKAGQLPQIEKVKVYKIRWLILALFVGFSASNSIQWIQFSIIADVVVKYYNIPTTWVDWTSMIYMVLYIPFIFPGSYLLERLVSDTDFIEMYTEIQIFMYTVTLQELKQRWVFWDNSFFI